jgi:hypothetical protein
MRRHDKKIHIEKVNILLEARNRINEDFDFDSYIDGQDVSDYAKQSEKDYVKTFKAKGWSDFELKQMIDREIETHKKYEKEERAREDKANAVKATLQKIKDTKTLLGQKIINFELYGVSLADGSFIFIDEHGQDTNITYENDGTDKYTWQGASSAWDYKRAKEKFEEDGGGVIFPNKAEAKLFMQIFKLNSGYNPENVKLKYIFTPDLVQKHSKQLPKDTFDYLNGGKIKINDYTEDKIHKIEHARLEVYDSDETITYSISMWFYTVDERDVFSKSYYLLYNLKLGKFRSTKKEDIEFTSNQIGGGSASTQENIHRSPDIIKLIEEIRSKFK